MGFINICSTYFSAVFYKTIPALPDNHLLFPCACPALQRCTDCHCPSQTLGETLNRIKLLIYFHAPMRILLLCSGLYSPPTCPWNKQTFNSTQVLSTYCLCGVYETILTCLQLTPFQDPRDRDSMKIMEQRSRSIKRSLKHTMVLGFISFPQLCMAVFHMFPTTEGSPSQTYRHVSHSSSPPDSSYLLSSSTFQSPTQLHQLY